jgi:hypothetical protein
MLVGLHSFELDLEEWGGFIRAVLARKGVATAFG